MPERFIARGVPVVAAALAIALTAADWRQFRGPGGSGRSTATGLPVEWDASTPLWKAKLPGPGASSPIVLGDRVFITAYSGYGLDEENPGNQERLLRHVLCHRLSDGKPFWHKAFRAELPEKSYGGFQAHHGYASSTLATDGQMIFASFGRSGVAAFSLSGQTIWKGEVGEAIDDWGVGTSPIVYKGLVIVNASIESESLIAVNKWTGRQVWKTDGIKRSWSTPIILDVNGSRELVLSTKDEIVGVDPDTGRRLWSCEGVLDDYVCPSPAADRGIVYVIGGRKATAIAVRAGGRGDVTQTHRLWDARKGADVPSPVYYDGHLYWCHDARGTVYCANAETGEIVYEQRLDPRPGKIYASPLVADGKIYVVSREKGAYVLAAGPEFELLAHNAPLDSTVFNASPIAVDGKLLLRSDEFLYCLGE